MNLKSNMLKILVVFALILMVIPAIAAEDTAQDEGAVSESDDVVLSESGADDSSETSTDTDDELEADEEIEDEDETELEEVPSAGEPTVDAAALVPTPSGFLMDLPSADVAVKVTPEYQTAKAGDLVVWAASFVNFGPDIAENAIGQVKLTKGDILLRDVFATYINPLRGMTEPILIDDDLLAQSFDPVTGILNIGDMLPGDVITLYLVGEALSDGEAILTASIFSDTYDPDLSNNVAPQADNAVEEAAAAEETLPAAGNPIAMALLALISIVGLTFGRRL